MQRRSNAHRN